MAGIFLKRYRYMLAVMVGVIAGTLIANYAIINITDKVGELNNDFRLSIIDVKVCTSYITAYYTCCSSGSIYNFRNYWNERWNGCERKCNEYGDKRNVCIHSDDISTLYNICHYYIHTNIHMGNQQRVICEY